MKDPKSLFPLLFASSWLGNFLLTILAFYLAFSHDGPLTPLVFLTVAVCILSGNLLPLGAYWLMVHWRGMELRAEKTESILLVRDSLKRSEEVLARLDEAEGALAKGILLARQLPEQLNGSLGQLGALSEKLDTMEVDSFTETLRNQTVVIDELQKGLRAFDKRLEETDKDVRQVVQAVNAVPEGFEELLKKIPANEPASEEADVSVSERLDIVFETLESVQDSLDGLLQRIAELQASAPEKEAPPKKKAEKAPIPAKKKSKAESAAPPIEEQQDELILEPAPDETVNAKAANEEGLTQIIAHAMVGMQNQLYIRGDEPWLSQEDGQRMELIGIGEFAWSMEDLKEPLQVILLLNDETPAQDGPFTLEPGQTLRVSPRF